MGAGVLKIHEGVALEISELVPILPLREPAD